MQRPSITIKRIAVGTGLIMMGLIGFILIDRISLWEGPQSSFESTLLFFIAAFTSTASIMLDGVVMGGMPIKTLLKALLAFGLWAFLFLMPVLLLPFTQEVLPIVIGFSSLLPVVLYLLYVKLKQKRVKDVEKKQG